MANETQEILLVEDNEKNLADARRQMQKRIKKGYPIRVDFAKNYSEAILSMDTKKYNGIITDIFYPVCEGGNEAPERLALDRLLYTDNRYSSRPDEEAPFGVLLASYAMSQGMLLTFCTDSFHHDKDIDELEDRIIKYFHRPLAIIDNDRDQKGKPKNWGRALATLLVDIGIRKHGRDEFLKIKIPDYLLKADRDAYESWRNSRGFYSIRD